MEYDVNKGVGKQVEFKGLTAMYLFILAGGLAAVLLAVVVLYLAGAGQWTCILGGIFAGGLLAWGVFRLNARWNGNSPCLPWSTAASCRRTRT